MKRLLLILPLAFLLTFAYAPQTEAVTLQELCDIKDGCDWDDSTLTCTVNGFVSLSGILVDIAPGETMNINEPWYLDINNSATINNSGTINNYCLIDNQGTINNSGTIFNGFIFDNNGTINNSGTIDNRFTFDNTYFGTINNNSGTIENYWIIENSGTINNSGTIANSQIIENSGTINNNSGTIFNHFYIGNDGTIKNYCLIDNQGAINNYYYIYSSGTINNSGTIANSGTIDNSGTIANSGTIDNYGYIYSSGTINNSGTIANVFIFDNHGTINNNSGTIKNYDDISNFGTINNNSGTITNINGIIDNYGYIYSSGTINNSSAIFNRFYIDNYYIILNTGTITNINGTIDNYYVIYSSGTINNSGTIDNYCYINNPGTINNGDTIFNACAAIFNNLGTLTGNPIVQEESCGTVEAVDLKTLGGNQSVARAINESGYIVGESKISSGESHAIIITPLDIDGVGGPDTWYLDENPADGVNDLMVDLGTLGGNQSSAYDINDKGEVVGYITDVSWQARAFIVRPKDINSDGKPDVWYVDKNGDGKNDLMKYLTPEGVGSHAWAINNHGQIAGNAQLGAGIRWHACVWTQPDDVPNDLESQTAENIDARAINDRGETVVVHSDGIFLLEPLDTDNNGVADTFFRDVDPEDGKNDLLTPLGAFQGLLTQNLDINNQTHIVGWAYDYPSNTIYKGFLWKPDFGFQEIGILGGDRNYVYAIAERGHVVGSAGPTSETRHAYIWTEGGGAIDLGTLGGWISSAHDVNEAGDKVVGWSQTVNNEYRATIWSVRPDTSLGSNSKVASGDVELTFDDVTAVGLTAISESQTNPGPDIPNFQLLGTYYSVSTTAIFSGAVTVAINYDDTGIADESSLKIFHLEDGNWVDVTDDSMANNPDTEANIIYGRILSFSWFAVAAAPKIVEIDIKPGSYPNCFNINGNGVIPVAILGSADFDVTQIDVDTLEFAGLEVRVKGNGIPQCSVDDVSGDFTSPEGVPDGFDDLVCQFVDDPSLWNPGDGEATLTGELFDGTLIEGTDSICIVPAS